MKGKIKQVIIKRYNSGRWFAIICVDEEYEKTEREPKRVVGIDVGIKHFLTDSEGRQIENPRFYEKMLERIQRTVRRRG